MKSVVAYCRTASALGSDPISGITHQVNVILRYAACHGLTVHETYMDAGMSGISFERPELQRLLAECCAGKIGAILATDPQRLSRDTGQLAGLLYTFQKAGARVGFATEEGRNRYPL